MRSPGFAAAALLLFAPASLADEAAQPGSVRLEFVPPPIEGVISLGIYSAEGALVRILHSESGLDQFALGDNGLITFWDGKDDAGEVAPAGTYRGRGFLAGGAEIEGEGFHCNDWIEDDHSPRIRRIHRIAALSDGSVQIEGETAAGDPLQFACDLTGAILRTAAEKPAHQPQKQTPEEPNVVSTAPGLAGTTWMIRKGEEHHEIRQVAPDGELLRRMMIAPTDPAPRQIAASPVAEAIYLLESTDEMQRLRGLALIEEQTPEVGGQSSVSKWRITFSKTIRLSDDFQTAKGALDATLDPQRFVTISTRPNPLESGAVENRILEVAIDGKGSYFRTQDRLPVRRISDTPNLRWAVAGHDAKTGTAIVWQGDGSVVEEFRISGLSNMLSFDCGEFPWHGPPAAESAAPSESGHRPPAQELPAGEPAPSPAPPPASQPDAEDQ